MQFNEHLNQVAFQPVLHINHQESPPFAGVVLFPAGAKDHGFVVLKAQ